MDAPDRNTNQKDPNQDSLKANTPTVNNAEIGPELNAKPTQNAAAETKNKEKPTLNRDWHKPLDIPITEWLVAFFTLVIMASSIVYTVYASKQWCVMRDTLRQVESQTTLMRQQLVGTEAALVVLHDFSGMESPETGNYGVNLGFVNEGHVVASKVKIALTVQREAVNQATPIGEPWHCDFDLPPILPGKVGEHQCFLQGLDKESWKPIGQFQQTIGVDGSFSYWNGFEEASSQAVCLRYIPSGLKSKFGSEGPGSFVTCDRYPGWIQYLKERMAGGAVGAPQPPRK